MEVIDCLVFLFFSSVDFAEDNVQSADDGDCVGQHVTARHFVHSRQMSESRCLDLTSVGSGGAVGNQVYAELALCCGGRRRKGVDVALFWLGFNLQVGFVVCLSFLFVYCFYYLKGQW